MPPGTKGVMRGNKFNNIVRNTIEKFNLDENRFEINFEKQYDSNIMDEIPDWYIYDKTSKKIIIGMNQLDLWGGGQQINRGYKYIINNNANTHECKILCVVCNKIVIASNKNKVCKLFETGFINNTLCYINGLKKIIWNYFDID